MKKRLILAVVWVVLFPMTVFAQLGGYGYDSGDSEFTMTGSGSNDEDFDNMSLNVQGTLGYFTTEYLELFLRQDFGYSDVSRGDDVWTAATRIGFDIVFDLSRYKPFIGANAGYAYGDDKVIEDQFIAGPELGLKYFATRDAYLYGLMEWQFLFEKVKDADEKFDDGRYVYSIGVGFKF